MGIPRRLRLAIPAPIWARLESLAAEAGVLPEQYYAECIETAIADGLDRENEILAATDPERGRGDGQGIYVSPTTGGIKTHGEGGGGGEHG
jgi:hypothetical protein